MFTRSKIDRRKVAAVFAINSCSCGEPAAELVRVAPIGDFAPVCSSCSYAIQWR